MTPRRIAAAVAAASLLISMFAGPASAQAPPDELSQVVCTASGEVDSPQPGPQTKHWTRIRTDGISVEGSGVCLRPAVPPTDALVFELEFEGSGVTTRVGHCLAGVILQQDILVDVTLTNADDPSDVRTTRQLWTTGLHLGSTTIDLPSPYPPVYFQIRRPGGFNLRGAGAYTEPIGTRCPGPRPSGSLFEFTYTGGDAQP